jgi:hypothetical protein
MFLFGSNVAIEQLNDAIEIYDYLPGLSGLPLHDFGRFKMMPVFHGVLQNDTDSQKTVWARAVPRRNRKNLANRSAINASGFFVACAPVTSEMQAEIDVPTETVKWFDGQKTYGHPDTSGIHALWAPRS